MRESREITSRMIADLGSMPAGEIGCLLTKMIRVVSFRIAVSVWEVGLDEDAIPGLVKQLMDPSHINQRIVAAIPLSGTSLR